MAQQQGSSPPPLSSEFFFQDIPAEVVARLESFAHHRLYSPRQIIFFPDDLCDHVYLVRYGRIKLTHISNQGREIAFRHLVKGDLFGEECLLNLSRRSCYAEAISPTLLTLFRNNDFERIVREESVFAHAVACYTCRRAVLVERTLSEYVFLDVRERLLRILWRFHCQELEAQDDSLSLTHQELANLAGAARETVTAVLHGLRDEGIITLGNRRIDIKKPKMLHQLTGME